LKRPLTRLSERPLCKHAAASELSIIPDSAVDVLIYESASLEQ
jgi:hypothetical protein